MPLIQDGDYLRLDIPAIDAVHAEFAVLVNRLAEAVPEDFAALFPELLTHTRAHFAMEEALMRRTDFPGREEHLAEHGRVLGEMERFAERLAAGKTIFARAYIEDRIPDWFALHTQTHDYVLATFLKAKGIGG
jgi:hemerythrin-like metal-binding protein